MKKLLTEAFYHLGYGIESVFWTDSDIVEKFYREKIGKLNGKQIKHLFENSDYYKIRELSSHESLKKNSINHFPFHFRSVLKEFYSINGTHKPYPDLSSSGEDLDERILRKNNGDSFNIFDVL